MRRIGTLSGRGVLAYEGEHIADVEYFLEIFRNEPSGIKSGTGHFRGDIKLFAALMDDGRGQYSLSLEEGGSVDVHLTTANSDGVVIFQTSGPVPGY